jgi:D-alanyl-D-alanine carboxypeptidase
MSILSPSLKVSAGSVPGSVPPPAITSEAFVLMDYDSGQVILSRNMDMPLMPASTTKMMTALLVMENAELEELVTIGKNPPLAEGASLSLKETEEIYVRDLLYSLILRSANDAAIALAEHISGSVEEFAVLMNRRAVELGAKNTNFLNPNGLTLEGQVTTAYDLSMISREVAKYQYLVDIFHTGTYKLPPTNLVPERWAVNKNELLRQSSPNYYDATVVAKTGFTPDARYTYTAVAEKDNKRFIVSILKAQSQQAYYAETIALFNWAFENCNSIKLYAKDQPVEEVILKSGTRLPLVVDKDFYMVTQDGTDSVTPTLVYKTEGIIEGTFQKGQIVSEADVMVEGKRIGSVQLVSSREVIGKADVGTDAGTVKGESLLRKFFAFLIPVFYVLGAIVLVLFAIRTVNLRKRRRRRRRVQVSSQKLQEYRKRQVKESSLYVEKEKHRA